MCVEDENFIGDSGAGWDGRKGVGGSWSSWSLLLRLLWGCRTLERTRSSHSLGSPSLDVLPVPRLGSRGQLGASEPRFKGSCSLGLSTSQLWSGALWCYAVNVDQAELCPFPASPPGAAGCLSAQQMRAAIHPEKQQWFLGLANSSSKCLSVSWPHLCW